MSNQPFSEQQVRELQQKAAAARENNAKTEYVRERPQRVPLNSHQRLVAPSRPGYVRRFVNSVEDRIERFKAAWWDPVEGHVQTQSPRAGNATQMGALVDRPVGGGVRAVLMEIPEELYNEDQKIKQDRITAQEKQAQERYYKDGVRTDLGAGYVLPGIREERSTKDI